MHARVVAYYAISTSMEQRVALPTARLGRAMPEQVHLGRALAGRGVACTVRALAGHNHMSICTVLADAKSEPMRLIPGQMELG